MCTTVPLALSRRADGRHDGFSQTSRCVRPCPRWSPSPTTPLVVSTVCVVASVEISMFISTMLRTSLSWERLCVVVCACGETCPIDWRARGRCCVLHSTSIYFHQAVSLSGSLQALSPLPSFSPAVSGGGLVTVALPHIFRREHVCGSTTTLVPCVLVGPGACFRMQQLFPVGTFLRGDRAPGRALVRHPFHMEERNFGTESSYLRAVCVKQERGARQ